MCNGTITFKKIDVVAQMRATVMYWTETGCIGENISRL